MDDRKRQGKSTENVGLVSKVEPLNNNSCKVKTKSHLFSYLVLAGSECCPMCQLLQTGTNYHITYFWLLQVAPILWYYID